MITVVTGPIKTFKNFIWEERKERVPCALILFNTHTEPLCVDSPWGCGPG